MRMGKKIKIGITAIALVLVVGVTFSVSYAYKSKKADIYVNNEEYYIEDDLIKPVKLKTSKTEFQKAFATTGDMLTLECENGTEYVGTNCALKAEIEGESATEYKVVVYGDLSGDGRGTITDIVKMVSKYERSAAEEEAGDIDYNEKIDIDDAKLLAKNIILNEEILLPKSKEVATKIELSKDKVIIARGESEKVEASTNKDNISILSWKSNDPTVAEVDDTGEIRGVGEGKTTIEVTASDGTKREIEVEGYIALTGISIDKKSVKLVNNNVNLESETLVVTKTPSDATIAVSEVKWESNNTDVAKVDSNGKIRAVGKGHATITATITDIHNNKTYTDTSEVEVTTQGKQVTINKKLLELNTTTKTSETLTAEVSPKEASNKEVTWSVVSGSAVSVDERSGLVTVIGPGEATIRATAKDGSGAYGECDVKVYVLVNGLTLTKTDVELDTAVKTSETIGAIIDPGNATDQNIVWSSDADNIAKVENGTITVVGEGSTVIRASLTDTHNGNRVYSATCNVRVTKLDVAINIDKESLRLAVDGSGELTATISPDTISGENIIWESDNSQIASVTSSGKKVTVTGNKPGIAKITAKTNDGTNLTSKPVVVTVGLFDTLDKTFSDYPTVVNLTSKDITYAYRFRTYINKDGDCDPGKPTNDVDSFCPIIVGGFAVNKLVSGEKYFWVLIRGDKFYDNMKNIILKRIEIKQEGGKNTYSQYGKDTGPFILGHGNDITFAPSVNGSGGRKFIATGGLTPPNDTNDENNQYPNCRGNSASGAKWYYNSPDYDPNNWFDFLEGLNGKQPTGCSNIFPGSNMMISSANIASGIIFKNSKGTKVVPSGISYDAQNNLLIVKSGDNFYTYLDPNIDGKKEVVEINNPLDSFVLNFHNTTSSKFIRQGIEYRDRFIYATYWTSYDSNWTYNGGSTGNNAGIIYKFDTKNPANSKAFVITADTLAGTDPLTTVSYPDGEKIVNNRSIELEDITIDGDGNIYIIYNATAPASKSDGTLKHFAYIYKINNNALN